MMLKFYSIKITLRPHMQICLIHIKNLIITSYVPDFYLISHLC